MGLCASKDSESGSRVSERAEKRRGNRATESAVVDNPRPLSGSKSSKSGSGGIAGNGKFSGSSGSREGARSSSSANYDEDGRDAHVIVKNEGQAVEEKEGAGGARRNGKAYGVNGNDEGQVEDQGVAAATTGFSQALALNGSGSLQDLDPLQPPKAGGVGAGSGAGTNALKVLLLGSGESGKSTVLQQLKILHQNGFSREELLEYKPFIFDNIIETGKDLVKARRRFNIALEEEAQVTDQELEGLLTLQYQSNQLAFLPADLARTLKALWELPSTQSLISGEYRSSFYLMDSAQYFYDNLERISDPKYVPTITDVIRTRKKTSGIFDTMIELDKNLKLHIFDVGGQRSERKKWIHCFDNVTLIIFCVSLSEYDQTLLEDNSQNRLEESLILFDSVVNSRWFARSSVVLFLNKIDIFADKIQHVPLEKYFPDYTGGTDINKAAKYILWRFVQLNRANLNIYPHVTQATDTSNINLVFAAIKETILENSLKDSGVL